MDADVLCSFRRAVMNRYANTMSDARKWAINRLLKLMVMTIVCLAHTIQALSQMSIGSKWSIGYVCLSIFMLLYYLIYVLFLTGMEQRRV